MATMRGGKRLESHLVLLAAQVVRPGTLRVGFLENATYPDGTPVAMVAAIQNFGAPRARIPRRPFFDLMIARKSHEWPKAISRLLKKFNYDAPRALDVAGAAIAGQLRESIIDTNAPPLSPVTLMLRKMFGNQPHLIRKRDVWEAARRVAAGESTGGVSTKPLVWTGHLLASVDHEVRS